QPLGRRRQARKTQEGSGRQLEAPAAGAHRSVSAPYGRSEGTARGFARRARRHAARGEDPPHRPLQRDREAARAGAENRADRLGAEPLQPGRSQFGRRAAGLREARHRVPAMVSAGGWGCIADSEVKGLSQNTSSDPGTSRDRLVTREIPGDAADSGHLVDRSPRRKRSRRLAQAERRRPQATVIASRTEPLAPASSTQENSSSPLSSATVWNCRNGLAAMPGDISARNTSTPL